MAVLIFQRENAFPLRVGLLAPEPKLGYLPVQWLRAVRTVSCPTEPHRLQRPEAPSARTREPELFQGGTVRVKTGRPRATMEPRFRAVVLTPKWLVFLVWSRGGRPPEKG